MIRIDGSYMEGGGQILRAALALSSVTLQPFEIVNIRKGRPKAGIQPQHLACVRAVESLCNASSEGAELGSLALKFYPGRPQARTLSVDIGTAGSVTLLLQAILLPSLFAPGKVRLKLAGGTDVLHSQPADYFSSVFLPHIAAFGMIDFSLLRRGYFPRGGGVAELEVRPLFSLADYGTFADFQAALSQQLHGISLLERGSLLKVSGVSHASADLKKAEVAERQAAAACLSLSQQLQKLGLGCGMSIRSEYSDSLSTGSGISLFAHFAAKGKDEPDLAHPVVLGADALGDRGKRAEAVGQEAAHALVAEIASGACADRFLADQLIPFMALAGNSNKEALSSSVSPVGSTGAPSSAFGSIIKTSEITNHCLTNIYVTELFLGRRFAVESNAGIIRTLSHL